ncbi:MAG: HupE/UreJ family protein [Bdellovibrionales bacterium]|nr:HupE/UreJ family protein [Ramlibacter sp.]
MSGLRACIATTFTLIALLASPAAQAHKASDGYLQLNDANQPAGDTRLQLSLAVKDLDAALESLDADNDRRITWGETRRAMPAIVRWVDAGAAFRCGNTPVNAGWKFESLEQRIDGAYVRIGAVIQCAGQPLSLNYSLMKAVDPTHRLIANGQLDGQPLVAVLSPQGRGEAVLRQALAVAPGASATAGAAVMGSAAQTVASAAAPAPSRALPQSGPATLAQFFAEGLHHIVTGYDHLAFLLALMLPIVLYRRRPAQNEAPVPNASEPAQGGMARRGLFALFTTVTGFTIGHSLTLVLATFGVISASPVWVEPAIAITIAVSALLNLFPVKHVRGDALALGFGMIHGLAFSSVMTEAGISGALLLWGLAGFNLGVEAGQLVGVALWCAIHLALVRWRHYDRVIVRGGSWALLLLALYWTVQRIWP